MELVLFCTSLLIGTALCAPTIYFGIGWLLQLEERRRHKTSRTGSQ